MVSLITPSTVSKRLKIQLLALSLVVFVHHISLRILNFCIGYLLTTVMSLRFFASLIMSLHEPHYLSSLFTIRSNSHSLHSSSFSPLFLPYFNTKSHGFHLFLYAVPYFWNHLLNNIHTAPTYVSLRKKLKTSF